MSTSILLAVPGGEARTLNVEMSPVDLRDALRSSGSFVPLPLEKGRQVYVNPAYIVMAEEVSGGGEPLIAVVPR